MDGAPRAAPARHARPAPGAQCRCGLPCGQARVPGDVAPAVPQRPVVGADHHLVVAPGVVVGAAVGVRQPAVQLDPGREGGAACVGTDPPAVELLAAPAARTAGGRAPAGRRGGSGAPAGTRPRSRTAGAPEAPARASATAAGEQQVSQRLRVRSAPQSVAQQPDDGVLVDRDGSRSTTVSSTRVRGGLALPRTRRGPRVGGRSPTAGHGPCDPWGRGPPRPSARAGRRGARTRPTRDRAQHRDRRTGRRPTRGSATPADRCGSRRCWAGPAPTPGRRPASASQAALRPDASTWPRVRTPACRRARGSRRSGTGRAWPRPGGAASLSGAAVDRATGAAGVDGGEGRSFQVVRTTSTFHSSALVGAGLALIPCGGMVSV